MNFNNVIPDKSISLFVKNILVFEEDDNKQKTILPFFADGYPGLIFQETTDGLLVNPHNKLMPNVFLYGQTITPIELEMKGKYKLIIFQFYPFVLKSFFNVDPCLLNDNCFDIEKLENNIGIDLHIKLKQVSDFEIKVNIITTFLKSLFNHKKETLDLIIAKAIQKIILKNGQQIISELYKELNLTERTFERRFFNAVGVTAKQFCRMIKFQQSLEQLTLKEYSKLTDIVYSNGFSDQSHFIKVFKAYTGKTPMAFKIKK